MFILRVAVLYVLCLNLLLFSKFLPFGGLIGLFAILVPFFSLMKNGRVWFFMPKNNLWYKLLILYFVLQLIIWSIGSSYGVSSSIHQYLIYASMMICFLFVLLASKENILNSYIKSYIILATIMAFFGFIAWFLILTKLVGISDFTFDQRNVGKHLYSFPYYLGLVLTNVETEVSNIGNLIFYRTSGWAEEPAWAATFVMPALIILILDKQIFKRKKRILLIYILSLFWIVCAAVSSILSIFLTIIIGQILISLKKSRWLNLFGLLIVVLLIVYVQINYLKDIKDVSGFINSKINEDAGTFQSSRSSILWIFTQQLDLYYLMMLLSFIVAIIVASVSIIGINKSGYYSICGFVMLYLVIQGATRGWAWFSVDAFSLFFFYILFFSIYNKVIYQNKEQNQIVLQKDRSIYHFLK